MELVNYYDNENARIIIITRERIVLARTGFTGLSYTGIAANIGSVAFIGFGLHERVKTSAD